jgi:hypothetical protein
MVLILKTQGVEKSLLEISRYNLTTYFAGVLKMHSGQLKMRFMPTAPIHILWYILNFFDCLGVSKCVFIWYMFYIRVPFLLIQKVSAPKFLWTYSTLVGYIKVFCRHINIVLILRTQRVEKSPLEISRINLSTDICGVLKMHSGELKMRFLPTAPFHIVWNRLNILTDYRLGKVFSFEIFSTFVFLLCDSKGITTQTSINLIDCSRLYEAFFFDLLTWSFFWAAKVYRKAYWKFPGWICQLIVVVYYNCVLAS